MALLQAPGGVTMNVYVTGSDVGADVPTMDLVEYLMPMIYVPGVPTVNVASVPPLINVPVV